MTTLDELDLAKRGAVRLGECPERLDRLEQLVGQPADEHTKPLFDIVAALNRDFQELKSVRGEVTDDELVRRVGDEVMQRLVLRSLVKGEKGETP